MRRSHIRRHVLVPTILRSFLNECGRISDDEQKCITKHIQFSVAKLKNDWKSSGKKQKFLKTKSLMHVSDKIIQNEIIRDGDKAIFGCRSGCSHCCKSERISVGDDEAILALLALEKLNEKHRLKILANIATYTPTATATIHGIGSPCVFLVDGKCSIYNDRPFTCRTYFSPSAKDCLKKLKTGENVVRPYKKGLVMGLVATAVKDGYGGIRYEMNSIMKRIQSDETIKNSWLSGYPTVEADLFEKYGNQNNLPTKRIPTQVVILNNNPNIERFVRNKKGLIYSAALLFIYLIVAGVMSLIR